MKKIYVAIPYTGYEEKSFELANKYSYEIIQEGHIPFSPISMSHPIVEQIKRENKTELLGTTWDVWEKIDCSFIKDWCDEIWVIQFSEEAVKNSTGVQAEIEFGKSLGKVIKYMNV